MFSILGAYVYSYGDTILSICGITFFASNITKNERVATSLNLNTVSNSLPCGNVGVGTSRTAETRVYFETLDTLYTVNSTNKALWVTDGTLVGTVKVVGGPPTTFAIDNLSTQFTGSAEHCGDDLHFAGKNGSNATRLISVNGSNYTVQTNSFGLPSTQPSILKTASGIEMIGSPFLSIKYGSG